MSNNFTYIFSFILISLLITLGLIHPTNFWFDSTQWLLGSSDLTNSQISWQYFRLDDWRFPLGKNPNYGMEVANSIVFTDNIPLFAILFKIFNFIIYENFQYFSFWVFLCFFLQLFFSYTLILKFTNNKFYSFLGSFLFLLCPFLIFRLVHHFSLGAHWLILYAFYICYCVEEKVKNYHWVILISLSLLIHLYFTVMIFIIYFCFKLEEIINKKDFKILFSPFLKITYALIIMFIIGYFESSPINSISSGYGEYKLDLLSFFDPKAENTKMWSIFLKDINGTHLEGFNYIGLGNVMILFLAVIMYVKNYKKKKISPINIFKISNLYILIFLIWALTTNLSFMGKEVFNIDLPKYLLGLLSIFSSTGRFAWPVIYIFLFISIVYIFKNFHKTNSIFIMLILMSIQLTDVIAGIKNNSFKQIEKYDHDPIWNLIEKDFKSLRTTYLFNNYGSIFNNLSKILGNLQNIKTDITLNASLDRTKAAMIRYNLTQNIKNNRLDSNTAYIVDNLGHLIQLKHFFRKKNVGFFYRDDFWIMLPNKKKEMKKFDIEKLNQIKFTKLELNKVHKIKFKSQLLGFGWTHNFNKDGAWTEGQDSYLNFKSPGTENNKELILNIRPYQSNDNKNFELEIFLNDNLIKKVNFHDNKKKQVIRIPIKKNINNKNYVLNFKLNNLISPYDNFESPDARKLGMLLKSLQIKEVL